MNWKPLESVVDPELHRFLSERLALIRRLYQPSRLILFGSRAAGNAEEYSDIDLILVSECFRGQRFLDRLNGFNRQMAWDRHIDALCYTPEEFASRLRLPTLVKEAAREGITVV
jgi:predicted nucleotidyltransferase